MSFSSFISRRLSLRDGGRRFWPPAIIVAVGGVALSFMVMLLAIAVVTGFKAEISRKIMGFDAQIRIMPLASFYGDEDVAIALDGNLRQIIDSGLGNLPEGYKPETVVSLRQAAMLKTDNDFMGVAFRSFGDGYGWDFERENLVEGSIPNDSLPRGIMISETMGDKLGLRPGDKVDAYFFVGETVRPRKFEITGIYRSDFGEYDNLVAYVAPSMISRMLKLSGHEGEAVEIRGLPADDIIPAAQRLQSVLSAAYAKGDIPQNMAVTSVYSSAAMYFNWLGMLDTNIVVILILMGCVSGLMLVSCVLILILQRVRMVGLLKSLGASNRQVGMIFVRLGVRVTLSGLLIGNAVALAIIGIQWRWHLLPLDPESYYLSFVPVELPFSSWAMLNSATAVMAFVIMLLPAAAVSRLSPVKVMRFE
ncbi:MAG: ABC transporter permease [Muribaculaceae bacterium]|nr:ABC transporter permease [Muribaculaceae bacterium]